jgi:hypothetical protein
MLVLEPDTFKVFTHVAAASCLMHPYAPCTLSTPPLEATCCKLLDKYCVVIFSWLSLELHMHILMACCQFIRLPQEMQRVAEIQKLLKAPCLIFQCALHCAALCLLCCAVPVLLNAKRVSLAPAPVFCMTCLSFRFALSCHI